MTDEQDRPMARYISEAGYQRWREERLTPLQRELLHAAREGEDLGRFRGNVTLVDSLAVGTVINSEMEQGKAELANVERRMAEFLREHPEFEPGGEG